MLRRRVLWVMMLALAAACGGSSSSDETSPTPAGGDALDEAHRGLAFGIPGRSTTHAVVVRVTGLAGAIGLTLRNNVSSFLAMDADGVGTFATRVADGGTWDVSVSIPPRCPVRKCTVANGFGMGMSHDQVVEVTCVAPAVTLFTSSWGDDPDWLGMTDDPLTATKTRRVTWSGLAGKKAFTGVGNTAVDPVRSILYVADQQDRRVLVYPYAFTVTGDVAPARIINLPASATTVKGVAVSTQLDRLWVSTGTHVMQFNGASGADGTPDPAVVLPVAGASAMDYSWATDRLFVADPVGRRVVTFDGVSTVSAASTAARVLNLTTLHPYAVRYDQCSAHLFIGSRDPDAGGNGLVVFYDSRVSGTVNEDVDSEARMQGGNFMMLALDGVGNLYTAPDSAVSVRVYADAGAWYGAVNPSPVRTLTTAMNKGYGLAAAAH
jgi:hypothetical protein